MVACIIQENGLFMFVHNPLDSKEVQFMFWLLLSLFSDDIDDFCNEHPFEGGMFLASIFDDDD